MRDGTGVFGADAAGVSLMVFASDCDAGDGTAACGVRSEALIPGTDPVDESSCA